MSNTIHVGGAPARGCIAALGFFCAMQALAQSYPAKPIRLIVGFPPGGSLDVIARLISPKLSENLGQQVIVDNRSGASGNIAAEVVMNSPPDGYTLLNVTVPYVVNPYLFSRVPYDAHPIAALIAAQEASWGTRITARRRVKQLLRATRPRVHCVPA